MFKKTIKYTDYNGTEREEEFYFNYTLAEILEQENSRGEGLTEWLKNIVLDNDRVSISNTFKHLILGSYGVKSQDGKRFVKSEELSKEFSQTPAYSALYMELFSDENAAWNFVKGIMPKEVSDQIGNYDASITPTEMIKNIEETTAKKSADGV